ncbi:MAG: UDP-N-acetylglucosamine 2-epimerase (non-hydrolyzing) [Planctomycetaceae bacterium]|nr:UDP-N-acetylglucosamine 2-epimerase (non-hydrolyzing) [Planctomycetaceae bacterium]
MRALFTFGTRPEAIKIAPILHACRRYANQIEPIVCSTGQHKEMLQQVTDYFDIESDYDLELMRPNQTLTGLTARCLEGLDSILEQTKPDCLVAQGDTTTVMAASIVAFYRRIPFVHVEAGLRTGNMYSPWPEEFNRRVAGLTTGLHCAPTQRSAENLLREGFDPKSIHVTGNTVIDSLLWALKRERLNADCWDEKYEMLGDRRMTLITGHRRENFGGGFENICRAVAQLATDFPDVEFVYPVHLNPNVQGPVHRVLGNIPNVHLVPPAAYPEFVYLMDRATLILTDSGGVQEEAPSLKKPVLVMRDTTERPEAVEAGAVELVGTSFEAIVAGCSKLLSDPVEYAARQIDRNPYGDGQASSRIIELMLAAGWQQETAPLRRAA